MDATAWRAALAARRAEDVTVRDAFKLREPTWEQVRRGDTRGYYSPPLPPETSPAPGGRRAAGVLAGMGGPRAGPPGRRVRLANRDIAPYATCYGSIVVPGDVWYLVDHVTDGNGPRWVRDNYLVPADAFQHSAHPDPVELPGWTVDRAERERRWRVAWGSPVLSPLRTCDACGRHFEMRTPAAQKKAQRRADVNRVARKAARERLTDKYIRGTYPPGPKRGTVAVDPHVRAVEHECKRIAGRLAKLYPDVRRRFTRTLGKDGFSLTLTDERIQVVVTNGPTLAVRVMNAFGVPDVRVFLGSRLGEHGPLTFEHPMGDWATFEPSPGLRHLAKGFTTDVFTGRMSSSFEPVGVRVGQDIPRPGRHELVIVSSDPEAAQAVGETIADMLGKEGALTVDDNGVVTLDCRSDEERTAPRDLGSLGIRDLKRLASERGIPGYGNMPKVDLIAALRE